MTSYPKIIEAIWKNDLNQIKKLIHLRNDIDPDGRSPLLAAVIDTNIAAAKLLLKAGVDVNFQDPQGWTALHFAAQEGSLEMVNILIDSGAEIEAEDEHGNTPLWRATMSCQQDGSIVLLLIERGANPNYANQSGVSPIDLANNIGNRNITQFFNHQNPGVNS